MIGMMPFFRTRPPTNALENATKSIPRLLHCRLHDLNWFHFFRLHFFRLHFMVFIAFSVSPPNFSPLEVYACRSQQLSCQSVDKILSPIAQVSSVQSLLRIKLCQSTFMLPKVLLINTVNTPQVLPNFVDNLASSDAKKYTNLYTFSHIHRKYTYFQRKTRIS